MRQYSAIIRFIHPILLSFFMPAFVLVTGYFSKDLADEQSNKRLRIFNYVLLYTVCQLIKIGITPSASFLKPAYANWFLVAIIVWYTVLPLVAKIKPLWAITIVLIIGVLINLDPQVNAILQVSRVVSFFPFFLLGFYCSKENMVLLESPKCRNIELLVLAVSLIFCVTFWVDAVPYGILHANKSYSAMHLSVLKGFAFKLVWYVFASIFSFGILSLIPRRKAWYTVLGTRTLAIYIVHTLIYAYIINHTTIFSTIGQGENTFLIIFVLSLLVTLACGSRWLSYLFNKFMHFRFSRLMHQKSF